MRESVAPAGAGYEVRVTTSYGDCDVRVWPVDGMRRLYILAAPLVFPKGHPVPPGAKIVGVKRGKLAAEVRFDPGTVLFPIWRNNVRRHDVYAGGVYDAIRGRVLTALGYGLRGHEADPADGEVQDVRALKRSVVDVWQLLRDYGKLETPERQRISHQLRLLSTKLALATNEQKVRAHDQMAAASSVTDRLHRPNPGAARTRLVTAASSLDLRLAEIRRITPVLGAYEVALIGERDRIMEIFSELHTVLWNLIGPAGILGKRREVIERQRTGMGERLRGLASELDKIRIQPFLVASSFVANLLRLAAVELQAMRIDATVTHLEHAFYLVVLRTVVDELERLRLEFSCIVACGRAGGALADRIKAFEASAGTMLLSPALRNRYELPLQVRVPLGAARKHATDGSYTKAKNQLASVADNLANIV